jgi:uncharacterized protein YcbK (DUF882 family)
MSWNRRRLLISGGALAGVSLGASWAGADDHSAAAARHIELHNLHTAEHESQVYWHDGAYDPEALSKIERLLRDFRNDQRHEIDPKLLDYLTTVAASLGREPKFSVISGYRSPQTNEALHEKSSGVSQHSLHMQGRAIDVRMNGLDCAQLADRAIELKLGGVGYYRASDFVHMDTGKFRTWRG